MVHFIFMDHKNFLMCILYFLWPTQFTSVSVSVSMFVGFLFFFLFIFFLSFFFFKWHRLNFHSLSTTHSISFTRTHTYTFSILLRIFSSIYTHYYYYYYQLYWPFRFVSFVPFRLGLAHLWLCALFIFFRLHFKWDNTKESLYSCSTQLNGNKSVIVSRNINHRECRRRRLCEFFFLRSLNILKWLTLRNLYANFPFRPQSDL